MAWTTPRTFSTSELVTASHLNVHIRDNLSAGPHAATVALLNTDIGTVGDGAKGFLRLSSTPYNFIPLVYDATYTKWIGPENVLCYGVSHGASGSAAAWEDCTSGSAVIPYKSYTDAGLTLQCRIFGLLTPGASTCDLGIRLTPYAAAGVAGTPSTDAVILTASSGANMLVSDWATAPSITADALCEMSYRFRTSVNNTGTLTKGSLLYRWVS